MAKEWEEQQGSSMPPIPAVAVQYLIGTVAAEPVLAAATAAAVNYRKYITLLRKRRVRNDTCRLRWWAR